MKEKRAIFISTASQIIVRFFTLAFTLIAVKLITNYLGTKGTGDYNTINTFLGFFIVIADLGLFSVAVREIAKNPEKERKILSNVLAIRIITAILAVIFAVIIMFSTKFSPEVKFGTLVGSGFIFFNLLSSVYDVVLQYKLQMQFSALAEFITRIITLIALYIVIKSHGNFYLIMATLTFSAILIYFFKKIFSDRLAKFRPEFDQKISKWIFDLAWPLGIVFVMNNLFFKIDTLMVAWIKGSVAVGIYSTAYKVIEVIVFMGGYFASSLKPVISREIDRDKEGVARIIQKSVNIMLILSLPVTIISVAFSREIILFISSPDFAIGAKALIVLSFTLPFIYLDTLLGEVLLASNARKLLVKIAVFILAFNFLTNLYFIPKYSYMGAAFTTLMSEIVLFGVNYYYTKKILPYSFDKKMIAKIFAISLISYFFAVAVKQATSWHFLIIMALTLVLYILLLNAWKILTLASLKELRKSDQ
ncbi:MAG: flippase [Patescibacteria group bacterium]|jgi:O-antigen/teichoic acid export membrane protein